MPVLGVKKARRNLRKVTAGMLEAMQAQTQRNAEELLSDASDLAPQLSGDLIDSGKISRFDEARSFVRVVSFDTPYAVRWHEASPPPNWGEITRAKPGAGRKYLSRAYNKKRKKFEQRVTAAVNRRIVLEVKIAIK